MKIIFSYEIRNLIIFVVCLVFLFKFLFLKKKEYPIGQRLTLYFAILVIGWSSLFLMIGVANTSYDVLTNNTETIEGTVREEQEQVGKGVRYYAIINNKELNNFDRIDFNEEVIYEITYYKKTKRILSVTPIEDVVIE